MIRWTAGLPVPAILLSRDLRNVYNVCGSKGRPARWTQDRFRLTALAPPNPKGRGRNHALKAAHKDVRDPPGR
jgi:hypothetical protein